MEDYLLNAEGFFEIAEEHKQKLNRRRWLYCNHRMWECLFFAVLAGQL